MLFCKKVLIAAAAAVFCCVMAGSAASESRPRMLYFHIGGEVLQCTAAKNSTTDALFEKLKGGDLEFEMDDYGGFEKVGDLGFALPENNEPLSTESGDVTLYQGSKLAIYYGHNSWSLTPVGRISGTTAAELRQLLGNGLIRVRLSLGKQ